MSHLRVMLFILLLINISCNQFVKNGTAEKEVGFIHSGLKVNFISEFILPANLDFKGTRIGGLSSIDYNNGVYYLVCDDDESPRFYTMTCDLLDNKLSNFVFIDVTFFTNEKGGVYSKVVDPEALRFDHSNDAIFWCSEGKIKKEVSPVLIKCDKNGKTLNDVTLDSWKSKSQGEGKWGPRHNESLESLSISTGGNFLWVAQESPLKQDGKKPSHKGGHYPIRFSKIDKSDFDLVKEYVYPLDSIARPSIVNGGTAINGLSEIMCFDENSFLTIERSYVQGYDDGGNDVKIYRAFIDDATNVSTVIKLKETKYTSMKKELVVDFNLEKTKFPNGFVDNIEGISFGPVLSNGNKTIIVVSDDNFGKYGPQANQFILFEIE